MRKSPKARSAGLRALVIGCAAMATSCDEPSDVSGYVDADLTGSLDTSSFEVKLSGDIKVSVYLHHDDAHAALEAVRITDDSADPMTFDVKVSAPKEEWPQSGYGDVEATIHIDAEAPVPISRQGTCVVATTVLVSIDLVTDYGPGTLTQYLNLDRECW